MSKKEELEALGYKTYENDKIAVFWNPNICQHAGLCVKGNNLVFDVSRRPWIDLSKASAIEIAKVIDECPSKALQYELKINIEFDLSENMSIAYIGDEVIGECEFESEDDTWTILHTGVDEAYGGRGIAKKLVISVADAAIKYNKKIVPLCTYAKKVLENNDEYKKIIG